MSREYKEQTLELISLTRREAPLVHNITNLVVMQITANALLALGASPIMAHSREEAAEITALSSALVLNIGTLSPSWVEAMRSSLFAAGQAGLTVVLDPVGAGASAYRTRVAEELLGSGKVGILRGNASEISVLAGQGRTGRGVDSLQDTASSADAAGFLARKYGCVVCVSGGTDLITDGRDQFAVSGGSPLMARVTGMGCTASAFCAAFSAVAGKHGRLKAAVAAMAVMSAAGGIAARQAMGPGSFPVFFLDCVYALGQEDLSEISITKS